MDFDKDQRMKKMVTWSINDLQSDNIVYLPFKVTNCLQKL